LTNEENAGILNKLSARARREEAEEAQGIAKETVDKRRRVWYSNKVADSPKSERAASGFGKEVERIS